jgi:DNA-binding response OmpR family regulator
VPFQAKEPTPLTFRDGTSQSAVTLILNASPDSLLLGHRAKALNGAGYYTSSARTTAEALQLAVTMKCTVALICYNFAWIERNALARRLRSVSPTTTIVYVDPKLDEDHDILVGKIQRTLDRMSA